MALGRPLQSAPAERDQLLSYMCSRSLPRSVVTRARIIPRAAEGASNTTIARELGLTRPTVGLGWHCYLRQGLQGLYDELRPAGPRTIRDEQITALLRRTVKAKPRGATQWTCRALAVQTRA